MNVQWTPTFVGVTTTFYVNNSKLLQERHNHHTDHMHYPQNKIPHSPRHTNIGPAKIKKFLWVIPGRYPLCSRYPLHLKIKNNKIKLLKNSRLF